MTAVVDASVMVAALVDSGNAGTRAEELIGSEPLVAPELLLIETANVLRRLERGQQLSRLEANSAHHDLLHLDIDLLFHTPFASRVWELRNNLTSYDACYVAVAEAVGAPLATLDRKLSQASGPRCKFLLLT